MLKIKQITATTNDENCYIITDEATGVSAIIDPGVDEVKLSIATQTLNVKYILLTHGHYDHITALKRLRQFHSNSRVCIHANDADCLTNSRQNLSFLTGSIIECDEADILLNDGDMLDLGETEIHVLHTPGHTKGSVCYLAGKNLFSGDTLFFESVGRTDLPGGSTPALTQSIQNKLYSLSDDTKVYPGHMRSTTIEHEKHYNNYVVSK